MHYPIPHLFRKSESKFNLQEDAGSSPPSRATVPRHGAPSKFCSSHIVVSPPSLILSGCLFSLAGAFGLKSAMREPCRRPTSPLLGCARISKARSFAIAAAGRPDLSSALPPVRKNRVCQRACSQKLKSASNCLPVAAISCESRCLSPVRSCGRVLDCAALHSYAINSTACAKFRLKKSFSVGTVTIACATRSSSAESPFFSDPNRKATRDPVEMVRAASSAASRGLYTGSAQSRGRAVVANTNPTSAQASLSSSNLTVLSRTGTAPHARERASSVHHSSPQSGATSRSSHRPKFIMARAAAPMLPGSYGRASITEGRYSLRKKAASKAACLVGATL
mmetsp:Transcript_39030/g.81918  ORF Transcript_39030/g.81918 Transcript_39030/m.81918 type:complete len:337 (+) Transcript_39030:273-1283(+)